MLITPEHPYTAGGANGRGRVGHGVDLFAVQTRAFLDQIAGIGDLEPLPTPTRSGGLRIAAAVPESADSGGSCVKVS